MKRAIATRKDLPVPPMGSTGKYPWRVVRIGESFLIKAKTQVRIKAVHAQVAGAARRTGRRFTARHVLGGVRVWRVK